VRAYMAIAATRFRAMLQYRAAALGGIFTQSFFALVRIMIFDAFYRSSAVAQPLAPAEMVGYVWLGQMTYAMFPWNVDSAVREDVRSGNVVYELCRPLSLYWLWSSRALALRTAPVLLRLPPIVIVAVVIMPAIGLDAWRLQPPPDLAAAFAALAAMVGALALSCALTTLMSITMLWTVSGQGVAVMSSALALLLGGMVIPLPLFPDWAQPIVTALPFAGLLDLPARLYTGNIPPSGLAWVLAHQLGWSAALVGLGWWAVARRTRRMVVQGG
jgi:ABC-2 type transport system permease protein